MADIESQARPVENVSRDEAHDLSPTDAFEKDIDRSTLHSASIENEPSKGDEETIEKPATIQAAGPTTCPIGQVGSDDFVEGGFEGWKVIFGCALIAAPTVGELCMDFVEKQRLTFSRMEVS
ncbi:hypothetical protein FRC08_001882 [Ceratobasidium sp. 394]|nr:hypothetical protein FRC08_001882 [Ceratobasidium sp. 394]